MKRDPARRRRYLRIGFDDQLVTCDPWRCFELIEHAARSQGLTSSRLELRNVDIIVGTWRLTFEVVDE